MPPTSHSLPLDVKTLTATGAKTVRYHAAMALRMGALYDALRAGQGIPEDVAKQAAEEVANYDNKLAALDTRVAVLTWIGGVILTLVMANLWLTITILGRLPRP